MSAKREMFLGNWFFILETQIKLKQKNSVVFCFENFDSTLLNELKEIYTTLTLITGETILESA